MKACCVLKTAATAGRLRPLPTDAGRLRPLPTDTLSASTDTGHSSACQLIDMGAFYLAEFVDTHCRPIEGSAVQGGIHVLQIMPPSLLARLLYIAPLTQTCKVGLLIGSLLCCFPCDRHHCGVCSCQVWSCITRLKNMSRQGTVTCFACLCPSVQTLYSCDSAGNVKLQDLAISDSPHADVAMQL